MPENEGAKEGLIRRRHVLYVEGYDPQGAEGYHKLFSRSFARFLKNWPVAANVGDLKIDSDDLAHWRIDVDGPNWQVSTQYVFLRQEQMIRANMAEPMWRQVPRSLVWMLNYLFTGTLFRVFRASPQYGSALTAFQLMLLFWLLLSGLGGWLVARLAMHFVAMSPWFGFIIGIAAALLCFKLLRPVADKFFVVQINSHWPYLLRYARGKPSGWDRCIEEGARHLVGTARNTDAGEIVVVGHSGGGVTAPAVVVRALELDPNLGRHGPRVVLLTPGSLMPGIGVHRGAVRVHRDIARIAVEPSIRWIDVQARADILNFFNFDPVAGIGIDACPERCNPLVWQVRLRDMLAPEFFKKIGRSWFRLHYQFIMGNDTRAPYEYMMLVCGPLPVEQWAERGRELLDRFDGAAIYRAT